jgi:hypothetical protein
MRRDQGFGRGKSQPKIKHRENVIAEGAGQFIYSNSCAQFFFWRSGIPIPISAVTHNAAKRVGGDANDSNSR